MYIKLVETAKIRLWYKIYNLILIKTAIKVWYKVYKNN